MSNGNVNATPGVDTDEGLVMAFRLGQGSAFDTLVLKYKDRVFNMCYRMMGDYDEANDCAQEAFIKACRGIDGFRGDSAFSTWLYRIAVNTCKSRLTSLKYLFFKRMLSTNTQDDDDFRDISDERLSPEHPLRKRQQDAAIHRAIMSLPLQQRTVVVLRDIEGLSYEEIASVTGVRPGTVKSRIARGRETLREKLKDVL
ncbi:sigma-70 family RNA polymerase sigma factor [Candidatus Magnetobacterium casense]|uniref:Sigma-70 family RNA polymerase sigma factor n=1 Tax=Candidatus Magnetobacterium casense TaxID=1455061 RepID=A0ABS6S3T1_9BACT|nr:sigma-70 family RNA polymerase sigma factor [Candidatus Magnetobacterium casensis]MBV6343511.1 sigma-70 family RNA polymerase sigma factor [Candidatus Magnetobacterium casensis]